MILMRAMADAINRLITGRIRTLPIMTMITIGTTRENTSGQRTIGTIETMARTNCTIPQTGLKEPLLYTPRSSRPSPHKGRGRL